MFGVDHGSTFMLNDAQQADKRATLLELPLHTNKGAGQGGSLKNSVRPTGPQPSAMSRGMTHGSYYGPGVTYQGKSP